MLLIPPYDILLRGRSGGNHAYLGVTRSDPTLRTSNVQRNEYVATVKGRVSGGLPLPVPPNKFNRVFVSSRFSINSFDVGEDGTYGSLKLFDGGMLQWHGESTTNARLLAVQADANDPTLAQRPRAIGSKRLTLTSEGSLQSPEADLVLEPPRFRELEVKLSFPDGVPDSCVCSLNLAELRLYDLDCSTPEHRLQIPDLGDFEFSLSLYGDVADRNFSVIQPVSSNAGSVSITVPRAFPVVEAPLPNASGKASALAFQVTPARATLNWLTFDHGVEQPVTFVVTNEARVELTRLLELGLDLPEGQDIGWGAEARSNATTVDEALAPSFDGRAGSTFYAHTGSDWYRFFSYEPD